MQNTSVFLLFVHFHAYDFVQIDMLQEYFIPS